MGIFHAKGQLACETRPLEMELIMGGNLMHHFRKHMNQAREEVSPLLVKSAIIATVEMNFEQLCKTCSTMCISSSVKLFIYLFIISFLLFIW